MGGDSRTRSCGLESQHQMLDGHFFTYIVVELVMLVWKDQKVNYKTDQAWPIFLKKNFTLLYVTGPLMWSWAVVVFSGRRSPTIWVRILLKHSVFCKMVFVKIENKQKRGRGWPISKTLRYVCFSLSNWSKIIKQPIRARLTFTLKIIFIRLYSI